MMKTRMSTTTATARMMSAARPLVAALVAGEDDERVRLLSAARAFVEYVRRRIRNERIDAEGHRSSVVIAERSEADRFIDKLHGEIARNEDHTTETALAEYRRHLAEKGDKPNSIDVTAWAIGLFFPAPFALRLLTSTRCEQLYTDLRTRPSARTGKPLAATRTGTSSRR